MLTKGLQPSVDAHSAVPGILGLCSWRAGWRSLLLRSYQELPAAEEFTTAPNADQLIVLVTSGGYRIESLRRGVWNEAFYARGTLGMTAAGESSTLRWRDGTPTVTLHLHLPSSTIRTAAEALWGIDLLSVGMPNHLACEDALVKEMMLSLQRAAEVGVNDMFAETAAAFLAVHLLTHHTGKMPKLTCGREEVRLSKVNSFMKENLHEQISLEDLAREAGFSRFHLLRLFKKAYGETPFRRLTRMRIENGRVLLNTTSDSITQIAFSCGFENSSHFAATFRRLVGVSPSEFRKAPNDTAISR